MAYGLLLIRVVFGAQLAAHGAQKLFGWFGGPGPHRTAGFFGKLRFRAPLRMAFAAGLAELSGVLFALGFLTPLAALGIAVGMLNAIGSVHFQNGYFAGEGGSSTISASWRSPSASPRRGQGGSRSTVWPGGTAVCRASGDELSR